MITGPGTPQETAVVPGPVASADPAGVAGQTDLGLERPNAVSDPVLDSGWQQRQHSEASADPVDQPMRIRLDLGYDGTGFAGWAAQPGLRTVAGVLGEALETLLRSPVPLVVAGRTDTGVHAIGQVAHLDVDRTALIGLTPRGWTPARSDEVDPSVNATTAGLFGLVRRLARLLPDDIRVRSATSAPPGFDARFAALRRHYRYRIATASFGAEPLRRFDTLSYPRALDPVAMRAAAQQLLGTHDFAAFCKAAANPRATTIRQLQRLDVEAVPGEEGVLAVQVAADAFCHSMVRSLVGVLLQVGTGRIPTDRPVQILADRLRARAAPPAPAHGLTLVAVDYPPDAELLARAEQTRAVREP